jgi:signal transduction histidine kinase
MTKRKNNNSIEEIKRENLVLETKVKHLTNDLRLTREENETSTKNYFEIYSNLEQKIEERTAELTKANRQLNVEIQERKRIEKALHKANEELETRVADRTTDIANANEELRAEISERKRTEIALQKSKEAAEAANHAKSEFLANMGHEFRTPLNHVIGFTELVVDKNFGELNEVQEEYLNDVLQSSRHLLSLISDILDFSKLDSGESDFEPVDVNIKKLFRNTLAMVKEKAMNRGVQVLTDTDRAPEYIRADYKKLKKALYNLLSNAVKFTPKGGKIRLTANRVTGYELRGIGSEHAPEGCARHSTGHAMRNTQRATGDFIEISIKDTGIGIKPEDQARIFDAFEQGDGSASKKYQGSGLGLSLTKHLVELHGGKIWVESEGEGRGSRFRIVLPL